MDSNDQKDKIINEISSVVQSLTLKLIEFNISNSAPNPHLDGNYNFKMNFIYHDI